MRESVPGNIHHSYAIIDPAIIAAEGKHEWSGASTTNTNIQNGTIADMISYEFKSCLLAWFEPRCCSSVLADNALGSVSASIDSIKIDLVNVGHPGSAQMW